MPKLAEMTALQVRQWLVAHGHKPSKVNAAGLRWQKLDDRKAALDVLHKAGGPKGAPVMPMPGMPPKGMPPKGMPMKPAAVTIGSKKPVKGK